MRMFNELFRLAQSATLTLTISADRGAAGRMTINLLPRPKGGGGDPALSTPLAMSGTPDEFDDGLVEALASYREAYQSLAEQVEATKEVLAAAKAMSAKQGASALTRAVPSRPGAGAAKAPTVAATDADGDAGGEDDHGMSTTDDSSAAALAASPAPTTNEPDLFG